MTSDSDQHMQRCLSGEKLHGDDFNAEQIAEWFRDEAEAYADLAAPEASDYQYHYHALNERYGYSALEQTSFEHVLGMGSAFGDELLPLNGKVSRITILDPSDTFSLTQRFQAIDFEYVKPQASGNMMFSDNTFDLITCFGVLHHIPNISHVLSECFRCLRPGGEMLLREPIVSMGDWRYPRHGLTSRERGIPPGVLDEIIDACGFSTQNKHLCMFPPLTRLAQKLGADVFNSQTLTALDSVTSSAFSWNLRYHRTSFFAKLAPSSAFFILKK